LERLTSPQNPKIKQVLKLRERRARDRSGHFLIEGYRELFRAVSSSASIVQLFVSEEHFLGSNESALIEKIQESGTDIFFLSPELFTRISYRDRPDGLLGIAKKNPLSLNDIALSSNPLLIVAEAIEKPGNLGTILRSSDAVGADGLIVCDRCTDIYNPNVVRASVGTLFTVPVTEAEGRETLSFLKEKRIQIVCATPHAKQEYLDADLTGPVAIIVGTEQLGLSEKWLENADVSVRIPMRGVADSLNVATATTLLLYEVLRQRRSHA
jgi:TrmH family RNA methyltransferase